GSPPRARADKPSEHLPSTSVEPAPFSRQVSAARIRLATTPGMGAGCFDIILPQGVGQEPVGSTYTGGEVCGCHVHTALKLPLKLISRSLASPQKTGLVLTRPEGKWNFLRAALSASNLYRSLIGCLGLRLADAAIFEALSAQ